MKRRRVLLAAAALPIISACAGGDVRTFATLAQARAAVEGLDANGRSSGGFSLAQMLEHAAQSIEYSMQGFPQPKSALFQRTLGTAAWTLFDARGAMTHDLADPIPGAPPLALSLDAATARALKALGDFDAWQGPMAPHFAYGALDKSQYTRAHLMHLANHWTEVIRPPTGSPA